MIAQLGQHLRKWLLGMALAARNQAQAVVAKLESIEAEKSKGAERKIAPGAAKTARSGEPPAHWLQLVKRHAPELLQPGPPYASRPASAQVFETGAGRDESAGANPQEPVSANRAGDVDEAQTHENKAFSLKLARLSREHGAPPGRRPPPTPGGKSQAGDSDRPPEAAPRRARDDTAPHIPEELPAGSVNVRRAGVPATGAAKMTSRRFLSLKPNARLVDPPVPEPGARKAEMPVAQAAAARRFGSAAGRIEKSRPGKGESINIRQDSGENFRPSSPTGTEAGPFDRQADNRQAGFQAAASTRVHPAIKQQAVYESRPRPRESAKGAVFVADSAVKTSASLIERSADDRRQAEEVRPINRQRPAHWPADRVKAGEKRSRPPKFHWPELPGEKSSEDAEDLNLGAAWPSLPEAPSAAAESFWRPPETQPSEAESRNLERLRRIDEEQRGIIPWNASHF